MSCRKHKRPFAAECCSPSHVRKESLGGQLLNYLADTRSLDRCRRLAGKAGPYKFNLETMA
jgi:hypothetical protein